MLPRTNRGSQVTGYFITGTTVRFTGLESPESFLLRYTPTTTDFTALTDFFTQDSLTGGKIIIDSEYLQYLVADLNVLYTQWDEDPNAESLADFRFVRLLDELGSTISKDSTTAGIQDFTRFY